MTTAGNVLPPWGEVLRECIDADVASFERGKASADETRPEHHVADQRVSPDQAGAEDIPQHDLDERKDDHGAEEHDQEDGLRPAPADGQSRRNFIFVPPLCVARKSSTAFSTRFTKFLVKQFAHQRLPRFLPGGAKSFQHLRDR